MAVTAFAEQTALSVSTTKLSLITGTSTLTVQTTAGAYQVWVDPVANMAKSDVFELEITEKVRASGTARVVFSYRLNGAQTQAYVTPTLMLLNGWSVNIIKIAGTDRAFDTSVRKAG